MNFAYTFITRFIQGSSCDNDVHEVFKAMTEITLTSAFVLERENGEIVSWNCKVKREGGSLVITPNKYPQRLFSHREHRARRGENEETEDKKSLFTLRALCSRWLKSSSYFCKNKFKN